MNRSAPRPHAGLTLIEMIVTLAITSLLAAVLSQVTVHLARIEQRMDGGQALLPRFVQLEQLRTAIEAAVPTHQASDPATLVGDAGRLRFFTAAPVAFAPAGVMPMSLELRSDPVGGTTLLVELGLGPSRTPQRWPMALTPGASYRWRYLNHQGEALEAWPPANPARPMPIGVVLDAGPNHPTMVFALQASPRALPSMRELLAR